MAALGSSLRLSPDGATFPGVGPSPGWGYLDYPGANILMRNETAIERGFRLRACEKEPWTAAWLDTLTAGDLLFNIGACVGSYALIAAHRGARVVAVEANHINHTRLIENIVANAFGTWVMPLLAVCSATVEPWYVGTKNGIAGAAELDMIPRAAGKGLPTPMLTLPGVTLDDLAETYGQPTHLLIDVDGGELNVLRGGAEALKGVQDVMIEMSRDETIVNGCVSALVGAGLEIAGSWDERNGAKIEGVMYARYRRAT